MTFEEILDQAIAMLQRRGRVSYRTLKLQFQLDDELSRLSRTNSLEAQQLAVDEDGSMLVWTGDATAPRLLRPAAAPCCAAGHSDPAHGRMPLPRSCTSTPDAERRQLTVMFCDLVDSTTLSSQLDPEDYRDVVRAYQAGLYRSHSDALTGILPNSLGMDSSCISAIPRPMKMTPNRAVRTGLGILDAMGDLNTGLQQDKGIQLAVRLGIHTGSGRCRGHGWSRTSGTVGTGRNAEYCCQNSRTGCAQYGC